MTSRVVAALLVSPHLVEIAFLFQGTARGWTEAARCFQAPFVVAEGESVDRGQLDQAIRVVQCSGHGTYQGGLVIPSPGNSETSCLPYP